MTKIYYTTDDHSRVIPCCDWFEPEPDRTPDPEWKTGEIEPPAYEEHAIPLWKEENGKPVKRTDAEIQADIDALPKPEPTETEQLRADVDFLTMENEALEEQTEIDRADIDYLLMLIEEK